MKTSKKLVIFIAFIGLTLASCSKDDEEIKPIVTYQEENPLIGYLTNGGINGTVIDVVDGTTSEVGNEFTPLVKGKINAFVVSLPQSNSNLRVTLWNATTKTVIRTELLNVTTAATTTTKNIEPIELQKDKKYAITMNSDDWYYRDKSDGSPITYPITSGNIRFDSFGFTPTPGLIYPTDFSNDYYNGNLSFIFQRTE
jgi:uncharacterized lipoprotein